MRKFTAGDIAIAGALLAIAVGGFLLSGAGGPSKSQESAPRQNAGPESRPDTIPVIAAQESGQPTVTLSDQQQAYVKIAAVAEKEFPTEKQAIGNIDFNQDMLVQVFPPYQGRVLELFAKAGDDVRKGQTLYTIDSPDLLQGEAALIAAAGTLELQTRTLSRAKDLYQSRAVSQREMEQAISDQQAAEGANRAARDALRIFGKSDAEMDRIVADRRVDSSLVVASPIAGRVVARTAAPGLFVQPGSAPAPYTIADVNSMWMVANVVEADSPTFRAGQTVKVNVNAFPDRVFEGKIAVVGSSVDAASRRVIVRSEINDPQHELRAGMFANFAITTGEATRSAAIPLNGVVREGDGTMTVWVTNDRRHFVRRVVKIGMERDGYRQVLDGLLPGETVATEGAIFLSNVVALH